MVGQGAGELAQQVGLAAAEVAENHHEPRRRLAEPGDGPGQGVVRDLLVSSGTEGTVPLWDVQAGRVVVVGGQPLGLPLHQRPQIEQALVLHETAH